MTEDEDFFYHSNYENLTGEELRDQAKRVWEREKEDNKTKDSFDDWLEKRPDVIRRIIDPFNRDTGLVPFRP
jgi:hypothetical protein